MATSFKLTLDHEALLRVYGGHRPAYLSAYKNYIGIHNELPKFDEETEEWVPRPHIAFSIPACMSVETPTVIKVKKNP